MAVLGNHLSRTCFFFVILSLSRNKVPILADVQPNTNNFCENFRILHMIYMRVIQRIVMIIIMSGVMNYLGMPGIFYCNLHWASFILLI